MSNKTQLQTNNATLASLIQTLQGKAAGGGSSGNNIQTRTVDIRSVKSISSVIYMTTDPNGNIIIENTNSTSIEPIIGTTVTILFSSSLSSSSVMTARDNGSTSDAYVLARNNYSAVFEIAYDVAGLVITSLGGGSN